MKKYILNLYREGNTYTFVFTAKNDFEANDKTTKLAINWNTNTYDLFDISQWHFNHKDPYLIMPFSSNIGCSTEEAKKWFGKNSKLKERKR